MTDRILFLSKVRPVATGTGGQQRRHSMFTALQKVAQVDLLILGQDPEATAADEIYLPSLNRPRFGRSRASRVIDPKLIGIAQGWSGNSAWLSAADRSLLASRVRAGGYDMLFANRALCAFVLLSALGPQSADYRIVTDLDDLLSDVILAELRTRGLSLGIQTAVARLIEARIVRHTERRAVRASAAALVCSEGDRQKLAARYPGARAVVLPNISQATFLPPAPGRDTLRLLFVGSLDYDPNLDGLGWFLDEIWPAARARFGDRISLTVVGRASADQSDRFIDGPGVELHLNVPSLDPYYRAASACIVPVRYGGGTSIKTIEAMAAGRPVLSTSIGVRGLNMVDGTHYLGFGDAASFVAACGDLLEKPGLQDALVASGHQLWQDRFSQAAVDRIVAALVV